MNWIRDTKPSIKYPFWQMTYQWPGGGKSGGQIVAAGTPKEIAENGNCLTGRYLKRLV